MNILVFDIETVPDTAGGRLLYDLPDDLDDQGVAQVMAAKRREQTKDSDFLPLHLHRIVAISVVMRRGKELKVWSLGDLESDERELIRRFFDGIDRYTPTLVSWNGSGFDLPVLHYRALVNRVSAPRYWETGDDDREFRWNNYVSRYHARHTDIMDVVAGFQPRAFAPLDQIAVLLGLPGKGGMHGSEVWDYYQRGELDHIRNYCETDVLNTWLVFVHFELVRGHLTEDEFQHELTLCAEMLEQSNAAHLKAFAQTWSGAPSGT
jgi:predicted PolB exonuclease-like 3'-5' exonuclease